MTYATSTLGDRFRRFLHAASIVVFLSLLSILGYYVMRYAAQREGQRAVTLMTLNSTADLCAKVQVQSGQTPASIAELLRACRADGNLDKLLARFPAKIVTEKDILDAYGRGIRLEPAPAAAPLPATATAPTTVPARLPLPRFRSAGPDAKFDTADDLVSH